MKQSTLNEVYEINPLQSDEEYGSGSPDNHHLKERRIHTMEDNPDLLELIDDEPNIWKTKCDLDSDMISGYFYELVEGWPGEPRLDNDNFSVNPGAGIEISLCGILNMAELITGRDRLIYSISDREILIECIQKMREHIEELNFFHHNDREIFFSMIKALDYFPVED